MYIFTNNRDEIFHISKTKEVKENGDILVDNNTLIIPKFLSTNVYEIETIPEKVTIAKYCYTEEKRFYINENYIEPHKSTEEQLEEAKEQITNLELALAELYDLIENK